MPILERFKSVEAVIAGAVALAGAVMNLTAVSNLLDLPQGVAGVAPFLSTLAIIVVALLVAFFSREILAFKPLLLGIIVALSLIAGIITVSQFVSNLNRQSVTVECTNYPKTVILEPESPTERLQQLIDDGGGLESAWCAESRAEVRRLTARQNAGQVQSQTLLLILCEVLLGLALTLAAWIVSNRNR